MEVKGNKEIKGNKDLKEFKEIIEIFPSETLGNQSGTEGIPP